MSKENVKAVIDGFIKTNGRQEITGSVLNGVLNTMLTESASEEKLSDLARELTSLDTQINGGDTGVVINSTFVGKPNTHSATTDKFDVNIKSGETFKYKLSLGTATMDTSVAIACQVYFWNAEGAEAIAHKTISLDTEYEVTATKDIATMSFYVYKIATEGTFNAVVSKGEVVHIDGLKDDLTSLADEVESIKGEEGGSNSTTINVAIGSHSSLNDRIAVNVPKGQEIRISMSLGTAQLSNTSSDAKQIYLYDSNGNQLRKVNVELGQTISFTSTTEDIAYIGFYLYQIVTAGSVIIGYEWGNGHANKTIADLTSDVLELQKGGNDGNVIKASFNVAVGTHSSANDKISIGGVKKNESFKVRLSLGNAIMRSDIQKAIQIYFWDADGNEAMTHRAFYLDATTEFIATKDIESISFYMYAFSSAGSVNVTIEKCELSELYNTLNQLNKANVIGSTSQSAQCVLLHFSDIHSSLKNLMRVMDIYHGYKAFINNCICTGDIVYENVDEEDNGTTRGHSYWDKANANDVLVCVGNHDSRKVATANSNTDFVTEVYPKFIKPYVSQWGVVQPEDAETNGYCYYYKDYASAKVRLICLDTTPQSKDGNRFNAIQQTWLTNVLNDAKTKGYAVVIANHYGFSSTIATKSGNSFDSLQNYTTDAWVVSETASNIVDSFIASGGDFVCWLAGHTHQDRFTILETHNKQVVINVCESLLGVGTYGDINRQEGTKSQDAFNIISIDASAKMFRLFRYGADLDRLMRPRKYLTWDYGNKKLIKD